MVIAVDLFRWSIFLAICFCLSHFTHIILFFPYPYFLFNFVGISFMPFVVVVVLIYLCQGKLCLDDCCCLFLHCFFFFSGFNFICLRVNLGFSAIVFLNGATWTLLYLLLNRSTNMQSLSLLPCIGNLGISCDFFSLATYKAYCSSIEILNAAVSFAFSFDFFVALYHFSVACAIWFLAWFLALFFPTLWIFFFQFSLYVYWFTSVLGLFNELPAPP